MSTRDKHRKRSHFSYRTNLQNLYQYYREFGRREISKQQARTFVAAVPTAQTQTRTADRGV